MILEFQDGVTNGGAYNGTRDSMVWGDSSSSKKKNYGTTKELQVMGVPDRALLLAWDVSAIPKNSVVQSAQIALQVTNGSNQTFQVYALNRNWDEKKVTWNEAAKGVKWGTAGITNNSDRDAAPIGTLSFNAKGVATITLNAAGIETVQEWVNNPASNFGVMLQNYSASSDYLAIASREASNKAQHPKLSVAYTAASSMTQSTAFAIAAGLDATQKKA